MSYGTTEGPELAVDHAQAASLVNISELLEEAARHIHDSAPSGRHLAVVLLDGAVEAAIATCLAEFGEAGTEKDSLYKLQDLLMQRLGREKRKRVAGWQAAAKLHRARNLSQHHQIPVDSETLQNLEEPVRRFVETIVIETFEARLSEIALSGVVSDPGLVDALSMVEQRIEAGDYHGGYLSVAVTYFELRTELTAYAKPWDQQADPLVDQLYRFVQLAPFAPSLAELAWFERTVSLEPERNESEARRALRFVIGLIARWERYEATAKLLAERETEAKRPVPSTSGTPEVIGQPTYHVRAVGEREKVVDLTFRIAYGEEGSTHQDLQTWERALHNALDEADLWERSTERPIARGLTFRDVPSSEIESLLDAIDAALDRSANYHRQLEHHAAASAAKVAEERGRIAALLQDVIVEIPTLAKSFVGVEAGDGPGQTWIHIADDITDRNPDVLNGLDGGAGNLHFLEEDQRWFWVVPAGLSRDGLRDAAIALAARIQSAEETADRARQGVITTSAYLSEMLGRRYASP